MIGSSAVGQRAIGQGTSNTVGCAVAGAGSLAVSARVICAGRARFYGAGGLVPVGVIAKYVEKTIPLLSGTGGLTADGAKSTWYIAAALAGSANLGANATLSMSGAELEAHGSLSVNAKVSAADIYIDKVVSRVRAKYDISRPAVEEALDLLQIVMDGLSRCFLDDVGRDAFEVRRVVGDIESHGESYLRAGTLASPLLLCFTRAREAGARLSEFNDIRRDIVAQQPEGLLAVAVGQASERFVLAQMSRMVAMTEFRSRDDASAMLVLMNSAFEPAEVDAADEHDAGSYQALTRLHAAVTRDLADRALLLPRVVELEFPSPLPSLYLSNRIYYDGSRSEEIRDENKTVHPLFIQRQIRVLSE